MLQWATFGLFVAEHDNPQRSTSDMELPASHSQANGSGCFDKNCSSLTVDDVYEIAKVIGGELEKLIDGYGEESVLGLVPRVVKVLELLESFTARNHAHKHREEELLRTFESLKLQQKKWAAKDNDEVNENHETRVRIYK